MGLETFRGWGVALGVAVATAVAVVPPASAAFEKEPVALRTLEPRPVELFPEAAAVELARDSRPLQVASEPAPAVAGGPGVPDRLHPEEPGLGVPIHHGERSEPDDSP